MDKAKTTRSQQQPSLGPPFNSSNKAAKGYPAVTRFAQPPASSADGSNGLPHQLQQGVEALSGMSMAGTSVHYNSSAPAQIGALAYAAGNQIHLGPGQEQHLPHEAWHVVQQKQGRVKPTLQAKGLAINDDHTLETEADVMGQRAMQLKTSDDTPVTPLNNPALQSADVAQRKIGLEFQAVKSIFFKRDEIKEKKLGEHTNGYFEVQSDGSTIPDMKELELVTKPVEETADGRKELVKIMQAIARFLNRVEDGEYIAGIPLINWIDIVKKSLYDTANRKLVRETFADEGKVDESKDEKAERDTRQTGRLSRFNDELKTLPKFYIPDKKKHFHPQVTVGVKFERVAELIDHLTKAPFKTGGRNITEEPRPETKAVAPTDVSGIIKDRQTAANILGWGSKSHHIKYKTTSRAGLDKVDKLGGLSPKVRGLLAIFYGFAETWADEYKKDFNKTPRTAKYMMPFMLRNAFWPFFNSLTEEEVKQLQLIDTSLFDKRLIEDNSPIIKKVFEDMLAKKALSDEKQENVYHRDYFQRTNTHGHGGITEENYKDVWKLETVDDIGASDAPGDERRGAIIELRKLGDEVPHDKLMEFALAAFDLIVLINAREGSSSAAPPTPSPPSSTSSSSTTLSSSPLAAV
ncbi:eCIS core domain-containing protein [Mucilaginibacter mallensis]|nr:DUF4157 domain-containing protein [Mucilaginibacter mallensis]